MVVLSTILCHFSVLQMERKERKSPASDTLYEVVSLESETEREKRKTTASPGILTSGPGTMAPSPPEDDEEEGDWMLYYLGAPIYLYYAKNTSSVTSH